MTHQDESSSAGLGIPFTSLLAYRDVETARWYAWFAAHPAAALDVRLAEGDVGTVRLLVRHILAAELRYAQRLAGEPATDWAAFREESLDAIFDIGTRGRELVKRFLADATEGALAERLTFPTLSAGTITASKRKILANYVNHGVRHWAQIATALRQHGYADQWAHDLLVSDALE
ncbi:MAG TPA: DinB family protein [Gemmatimonadales bacterium]|nr:DinB family protein [Gemmatimonadales bacterium]